MAHQYIKQLSEDIKGAVFGNVGSKIVFRISEDDAKALEASFAPTFTYTDIMKIETFNAYAALLIKGYPQKPFNIKEEYFADRTMPYAPKPNPDTISAIKILSKERYGRPRREVEDEIMRKFSFN